MNSKIAKRAFSSLYQYGHASNPRVWLSVANNGNKIGDMVFELYKNKQPAFADHFQHMVAEKLVGSSFQSRMAGPGIKPGRLDDENNGVAGAWNPDGDLTVRHHKRGLLTSCADQNNRNGGEFMITFDEAHMLNGSQTVFGELVVGQSVLDELEKHVDRHGKVAEGLTIVEAGAK